MAQQFDLLFHRLEQDVLEANTLDPKKCGGCKFDIQRSGLGITISRRHGPVADDHAVTVTMTEVLIRVERPQQGAFLVQPVWNEDVMACELRIDGTPAAVWQISKRALEHFIFSSETPS